MPRCPYSKWGPGSGTTCDKPQNSTAAKELEERLQKMREDRAKVDSIWLDDSKQQTQQVVTKTKTQNQK
jgi:hypothetical protein